MARPVAGTSNPELLWFRPEDGGSMYVRNVGNLQHYKMSPHHYENRVRLSILIWKEKRYFMGDERSGSLTSTSDQMYKGRLQWWEVIVD